jgi:hypothetical protein
LYQRRKLEPFRLFGILVVFKLCSSPMELADKTSLDDRLYNPISFLWNKQ